MAQQKELLTFDLRLLYARAAYLKGNQRSKMHPHIPIIWSLVHAVPAGRFWITDSCMHMRVACIICAATAKHLLQDNQT